MSSTRISRTAPARGDRSRSSSSSDGDAVVGASRDIPLDDFGRLKRVHAGPPTLGAPKGTAHAPQLSLSGLTARAFAHHGHGGSLAATGKAGETTVTGADLRPARQSPPHVEKGIHSGLYSRKNSDKVRSDVPPFVAGRPPRKARTRFGFVSMVLLFAFWFLMGRA